MDQHIERNAIHELLSLDDCELSQQRWALETRKQIFVKQEFKLPKLKPIRTYKKKYTSVDEIKIAELKESPRYIQPKLIQCVRPDVVREETFEAVLKGVLTSIKESEKLAQCMQKQKFSLNHGRVRFSSLILNSPKSKKSMQSPIHNLHDIKHKSVKLSDICRDITIRPQQDTYCLLPRLNKHYL